MTSWQTGWPPNEVWVEVEHLIEEGDGFRTEVIEVMAYYGRDGTHPHWKGRDGVMWWPEAFSKWRHLPGNEPPENLWDHLLEDIDE